MIKTLIIIGLGGFLGSISRFLVGKWVNGAFPTATFPWGTFAANALGCFLLGLVYALATRQAWLTPEWRWFLAVGFCGSFTTFSTFSHESFSLHGQGFVWLAAGYIIASVAVGLLFTVLGHMLGKGLG